MALIFRRHPMCQGSDTRSNMTISIWMDFSQDTIAKGTDGALGHERLKVLFLTMSPEDKVQLVYGGSSEQKFENAILQVRQGRLSATTATVDMSTLVDEELE
ncbi:hypothetical protein Tco_0773248 [Tanacetum coccineum]|uniref:Uncharacterized protein n=1 Tax=Tanacetum coccineum TaxID=301880 RepID=A0ABQ4ZNW6_9ASTR